VNGLKRLFASAEFVLPTTVLAVGVVRGECCLFLWHSLVSSCDANDPAKRLNALASYRRIYLSLDCLGSLIAKLF
jgi:hypothetical protein